MQLKKIYANHDRLWFVEGKVVKKEFEGFDTRCAGNFSPIT
jgi:hypothetical protein